MVLIYRHKPNKQLLLLTLHKLNLLTRSNFKLMKCLTKNLSTCLVIANQNEITVLLLRSEKKKLNLLVSQKAKKVFSSQSSFKSAALKFFAVTQSSLLSVILLQLKKASWHSRCVKIYLYFLFTLKNHNQHKTGPFHRSRLLKSCLVIFKQMDSQLCLESLRNQEIQSHYRYPINKMMPLKREFFMKLTNKIK